MSLSRLATDLAREAANQRKRDADNWARQHINTIKEEMKELVNMDIEIGASDFEVIPALPEPTQELIVTPRASKPKGKGKTSSSEVNHSNGASNPLEGLQAWIEQTAKAGVNEEKVREIVRELLSENKPSVISVTLDGKEVGKVEGTKHYQLPLVLKALSAGVNIALTGTTATSKTTMAIQAAKALGKDHMLFKPIASPFELTGYMDANGKYVESNMYRAHKAGIVAIFDEFDASDPAATLVMNSISDNKTFTYPNGETVTNDSLQLIFTMNTKGTGSDRKFVGRNRLDAATLDRFVVLEIERDLALEAAILGINETPNKIVLKEGGEVSAEEWLQTVRREREKYSKSQPDKIISMRAVRDGWKLICAGLGYNWAIRMTITK